MKIAYRFGHMLNCDQGASGIINEYDFNRLYGARVAEYLKSAGHELLNCTPTYATSMGDSLSQGVNKANSWGADLFVSFHGNAFDGSARGSEVVCGSQSGIDIGTRIINNLGNLGFLKRRSYIDERGLYEIRETNMVAIIVEPLFVDSQADIGLFNSVGIDNFAKAIAEAINGNSISQPTAPTTPTIPTSNCDPNVLDIQRKLNKLKVRDYQGNALVEDGVTGTRTDSAIKNFQRLMGLTADGDVGNMTNLAFNQIFARPYDAVDAPHLEYATRYIQWRVGSTIDGDFGNATALDVLHWQAVHVPNSTPDGKVGNQTWSALLDD